MSIFASEMNKKQCFLWYLTALFAVVLAIETNWREQYDVPEQNRSLRIDASFVVSQQLFSREALRADASQLSHISSHQQRIQPTQGARNNRTLTPSFNCVRQPIFNSHHSCYDRRSCLKSALFWLSVSRDYYVIALRRIIR